MANHYVGEALWFRAFDHFCLLRTFGDAPILKEMRPDNAEVLAEHSKRYPRNEAARFIIEDLEKTVNLMQEQAPASGRLCKATAYALISRVALFEATWEKYHAVTCFVPGNSKWLSAKSWPEFKFAAGSAEAEYNFFFDKAIEYSAKVADSRERRCELIAEGFRYDDLRRWRTLDMMKNYQPEGMHLWNTPMEEMYSANQIDASVISQSNVSEYIRPLQIIHTIVNSIWLKQIRGCVTDL